MIPDVLRRLADEDPARWGAAAADHAKQRAGLAATVVEDLAGRGGRNLTGTTLGRFAWVSTAELAADALELARAVPDVDLVVGIARSGLLPASVVATANHVPMATVSRGAGVVEPGAGYRLEGEVRPAPRRVLVVDDTAASGREMRAMPALVAERWPGAEVVRAVVYCHPQAAGLVDLYVRAYPGLHYLEWNWHNAGHGARCAYDFDGVLCRDIEAGDDDGGPRYSRALRLARPLFLPRRTVVPLVVTARPERFRPESLEWLDRHGVRVERLVMRDWEFAGAWDGEAVAEWKAAEFSRSSCVMFAESDDVQARIIAERSGRTVLSIGGRRVYHVAERLAGAADLRRRQGSCRFSTVRSCGRVSCAKLGRDVDGRADCLPCEDLPA